MIEEKKNKNLAFRVTESRQEELKIISAKRKESIQNMLEQGLDLLLSGHNIPRPDQGEHASRAESPRMIALLNLLRHGDETHRKLVETILDLYKVKPIKPREKSDAKDSAQATKQGGRHQRTA